MLRFIVGDILGTGIYALPARSRRVDGAVWLPFVVALMTAFSYLELPAPRG